MLELCICCVKMDFTPMWVGLPASLASCPFSPKSIKIEIEEKKLRHFNPDIPQTKKILLPKLPYGHFHSGLLSFMIYLLLLCISDDF